MRWRGRRSSSWWRRSTLTQPRSGMIAAVFARMIQGGTWSLVCKIRRQSLVNLLISWGKLRTTRRRWSWIIWRRIFSKCWKKAHISLRNLNFTRAQFFLQVTNAGKISMKMRDRMCFNRTWMFSWASRDKRQSKREPITWISLGKKWRRDSCTTRLSGTSLGSSIDRAEISKIWAKLTN